VNVLPGPLVGCEVPPAFAPSQLAFGKDCLLRAVLGSNRDLPALNAHPTAELGRVFHKLLEMAVRGEISREGSTAHDAERVLERLLEEGDARLAKTFPTEPPRLRELFPPLVWRRKRRLALDLAERYLSGDVPRVTGGSGGSRNARDMPVNASWSEVRLEAAELRLAGQADLIQRQAGDVVIRDLKTGRALTSEGDVLPHIERQMRLYGTMAHSVWPNARVKLVIDDGTEREIAFEPEQQAEVLKWLREVLDRLPANHVVATTALADPGQACEGCAHRHLCPAYRTSAPEYWRRDASVRMPLDTWGEVVRTVEGPDGRLDVTLNDAAERTVKIFGLVSVGPRAFAPGDKVWLFGLRTRDRRGGPEEWRHPHNFFEVADDDPFARAWTLASFVEAVAT
jgi:RecB family exonuclease